MQKQSKKREIKKVYYENPDSSHWLFQSPTKSQVNGGFLWKDLAHFIFSLKDVDLGQVCWCLGVHMGDLQDMGSHCFRLDKIS